MPQLTRIGVLGALAAAALAGCGGAGRHPGAGPASSTSTSTSTTSTSTSTTSVPASALAPLTLGYYGPLRGPDRVIGTDIEDGEKLAVSQYMTDRANTPVLVDAVDSAGGSAAASELLGRHPVAVIGATDPGAGLAGAGIPRLSVEPLDVGLAQRADTSSFRVVADLAALGVGDADFLSKTLSAHMVAVLDDGSGEGRALAGYVAAQLDQLGVDQVGDTTVTAGDSTGIAEVATDQPDAVFYAGAASEAGQVDAALRVLGYQGSFMAGDGADAGGFVAAAGAAGQGAYLSCACDSVATSSGAVTFTTAFQAAYGSLPGPYAAEAFDATSFVLAAVTSGATTPSAIAEYLKTKSYTGVTGPLAFQSDGNAAHRSVYIRQIKAGKAVPAGTAG